MRLTHQVEQLSDAYVRKGGKDNRRQQRARMIAFAAHCEAAGAREMGQVGGKHVVSYWRALRASGGLADATLYAHWLAIRELWRLYGKPGDPPRPRTSVPSQPEDNQPGGAAATAAGGLQAPRGPGGAAPRLGAPSRARRGSAGGFCPTPQREALEGVWCRCLCAPAAGNYPQGSSRPRGLKNY